MLFKALIVRGMYMGVVVAYTYMIHAKALSEPIACFCDVIHDNRLDAAATLFDMSQYIEIMMQHHAQGRALPIRLIDNDTGQKIIDLLGRSS